MAARRYDHIRTLVHEIEQLVTKLKLYNAEAYGLQSIQEGIESIKDGVACLGADPEIDETLATLNTLLSALQDLNPWREYSKNKNLRPRSKEYYKKRDRMLEKRRKGS
jgi:hypothetical protein